MTRIIIKSNGFEITGHARYAKAGQDIVCAAVSAIGYTIIGALEQMANVKHEVSTAVMKCEVESMDETARIILETGKIGFRQIEQAYGEWVKIMQE